MTRCALVVGAGMFSTAVALSATQQSILPVIEVVAGSVIAVDLDPKVVNLEGSLLEETFNGYIIKLDMAVLRKTARVEAATLPGKMTYDLPAVPSSVPLGRSLIQLRLCAPPSVPEHLRCSGILHFTINMSVIAPPGNVRKRG